MVLEQYIIEYLVATTLPELSCIGAWLSVSVAMRFCILQVVNMLCHATDWYCI